MKYRTGNFQTEFSDWWLRVLLWSCPNMNVTGPRWWSVNIVSGNGLVPSVITWANIDPDICRHMASLGHKVLIDLMQTRRCISESASLLRYQRGYQYNHPLRKLTLKHRETHGCVVSTDYTFNLLDQFHMKILQFCWTTFGNEITYWKK